MKIVDVREQTFPVSRYADTSNRAGGLDTSAVVVLTDAETGDEPVIGYGFASIGRFGQGGLMRDRFIPRLKGLDLIDPDTGLPDPVIAWNAMMANEKPGGHGERSVAVGALDMAIWDACAKATELPLWRYIARRLGRAEEGANVPVYAGGGYYFPENEIDNLNRELNGFIEAGFTRAKIKCGGRELSADCRRIETAIDILGHGGNLAVDAIYSYGRNEALAAARAYQPYGLWWFEDVCDPLDFETMAAVAEIYDRPIAAGEATFSTADARNLLLYSGLRPDRDILEFDIAHCYGLPEFIAMIAMAESMGWDRKSFVPHGGHLFTLHAAAGLGLGGAEVNPHNFQPFGGLGAGTAVTEGEVELPELPGIGFESKPDLINLFRGIAE